MSISAASADRISGSEGRAWRPLNDDQVFYRRGRLTLRKLLVAAALALVFCVTVYAADNVELLYFAPTWSFA